MDHRKLSTVLCAALLWVTMLGGAPASAQTCGGEGQRECNVWENFPSCKEGRVAFDGTCYTKGACGKEGQRLCLLGEQFPSCNGELVAFRNKCVSLNFTPADITVVNDCGEDIESVRLYDQRDAMASANIVNFLAQAYDQAQLGEGKEITFTTRLPRNHPDGSSWLYKIRVSNLCTAGVSSTDKSPKNKVGLRGTADADGVVAVPCAEKGGVDRFYANLDHGDVVRVCGDIRDARLE